MLPRYQTFIAMYLEHPYLKVDLVGKYKEREP